MSGKVINRTCKGLCSRCGDCCGMFIPFTEKELSIIKEYVSKHNIQPTNRFTIAGMEARCCFFNEKEKKCNIYEARPFVCRDFKCDHKDWMKRRNQYEKRSKYNNTLAPTGKFITATFDDLVYEDYRYIIQYFVSLAYNEKSKGVDGTIFRNLLQKCNRLDLLQYINAYDENGNKIEGKNIR